VRAHAAAGGADARRVVTALSSAALASLSRAFVACAFNDAAREDAWARGGGGARAGDECVGALAALTGGGDTQLWPRGALPCDEAAQQLRDEAAVLAQARAEEAAAARRQRLLDEAAAARAARLREGGAGLGDADRARIVAEFERERDAVDAKLEEERARQRAALEARLAERRAAKARAAAAARAELEAAAEVEERAERAKAARDYAVEGF